MGREEKGFGRMLEISYIEERRGEDSDDMCIFW